MVGDLRVAGKVTAPICGDELFEQLFCSTGIGQGVAIPHAKHDTVPRLLGIVGLCRVPVNFGSIDGEPADIIALLFAPRDPQGIARERRTIPRSSYDCSATVHSEREFGGRYQGQKS